VTSWQYFIISELMISLAVLIASAFPAIVTRSAGCRACRALSATGGIRISAPTLLRMAMMVAPRTPMMVGKYFGCTMMPPSAVSGLVRLQ
jgi:hypothetical protein